MIHWEEFYKNSLCRSDAALPEIESLLLSNKSALVEEQFPEMSELERERILYMQIRKSIALHAARFHSCDELLMRYYYGCGETARRLSTDEQIKRAVHTLMQVGPQNELALSQQKLPDGSQVTVRYDIKWSAKGKGQAEAECSVSNFGRASILLTNRIVCGVQVWIPVDSSVIGVY